MHLILRGSTVCDVDALRGVATDVGRPPRGRGLDEMAALLQTLLPLVQYTVGQAVVAGGGGGERDKENGNGW